MEQFSTRALDPPKSSTSSAPESSSHERAVEVKARPPHVLFLIDHLMALGGGESNLLKVAELMPPELVRCSIATFRIKPEIRQGISVPVYIFPWKRFFHLDAWKAVIALRKLIRAEKVDIVQTYFETSNLWGGLVAKLSGALLLSSRRDMGILRKAGHALAYRLVNRLSDRVLAVSEEVKKFCVDAEQINPDKVSVVYNGVDLKQIAAEDSGANPFASADWAKSPHIVACVANIRKVKGIDVLIRTAQRVCREFPDAVFVIAGSLYERAYSDEIQGMIRSLNLERSVKLLGFVENPIPLLKMSSAFCLLSRSEGFSNALLEAMACGVPSVVTRVGGNPEAIADGKNGFLVSVEDDAAAAEKLLTVLRDPAQAAKIGENGRISVQTRFTADVMIQRLIAVYRDLLAERTKKT
jgi:glycosyltransferase involved in cell wall biosynthesis